MHTPTVFNFDQALVRTLWINDAPWFVAADVARTLGYSNTSKAIGDHCKGGNETLLPSAGGQQRFVIIPESDVYRLIFRSKLPAADRFEDWVTQEVLPAIRKTGGYQVKQLSRKDLALMVVAACVAGGGLSFYRGQSRQYELCWFVSHSIGVRVNRPEHQVRFR